jgi:hypothetical protein
MTMPKPLGRRALLRGACGVALGLPLLQAMQGRAGNAPPVKRLVVFFSNNGTIKSAWRPQGTETSFQLGSILSPLAPHQSDLIVFEGIDMESSYHGPGSGDPHMPGMAHMLTGTEMVDTGPGTYDKMGGGISVDQHIAQQLAAPTKFSSLLFGVQAREYSSHAWNSMSYLGPNQPVDPEDDPVQAWTKIFGDLGGGMQMDDLRAQRLTVLDAVQDEITALRTRLGHEDRIRLDQHLAALEEVEKSVNAAPSACTPPAQPPPVSGSIYAHANAPAVMKAQIDLLVASLACDLTRVATLQWREALGGDSTFVWLGQSVTHHDESHDPGNYTQELVAINHWFAQQLAYLVQSLKDVPDGAGTLFDSTAILWCNELSDGAGHTRRDMSYVLAGSCGGHFQTGRFLQYGGNFHNDLLVSLCNAMDVPATSFGNPAYCTGPLPNLI